MFKLEICVDVVRRQIFIVRENLRMIGAFILDIGINVFLLYHMTN